MFTGEHYHTLDSKNRIAIPAKLREELGADFMMTRSVRGNCIKVYSKDEWERFIKPIKDAPRKTSEKTLFYLHKNAATGSPDTQGRVILTQKLLEHAHIKKDAVVVGCGTYVEIWSKEDYEAYTANEDVDAIIAELEELGL